MKLYSHFEHGFHHWKGGVIIDESYYSGAMGTKAYSMPLFGNEVGIGYRFNSNIIELKYIRDLLSIDNLNMTKMYNSSFRLSYNLLLSSPKKTKASVNGAR